jgi:hypothetical protein
MSVIEVFPSDEQRMVSFDEGRNKYFEMRSYLFFK